MREIWDRRLMCCVGKLLPNGTKWTCSDFSFFFVVQAPCGGIPAAHLTSVTPTLLAQQIYKDLARARSGREPTIKLLYLTPERLGNSDAILDFMRDLHQQVRTYFMFHDERG